MARPVVPDISSISGRWTRRASTAEGEFLEGVRSSPADQAQAAIAAKETYKAAMTESMARGAYEKGLARSGNQKWREKTLAKGQGRFSQGIAEGSADYAQGFAPFAAAIGSVDLPNRGPRGSAANYNRIKPIGDALNKLRTSRA